MGTNRQSTFIYYLRIRGIKKLLYQHFDGCINSAPTEGVSQCP